MNYPLVSVVIPCFNGERYIRESVQSIIDQGYPNLEIIVVNDGSTDNSLECLLPFKDKITVITQTNQGVAAARNTGLKATTGKYIAFNDSDDIWLPDKLLTQVQYLEEHKEVGICYSRWRIWNADKSGNYTFPDITESPSETDFIDKDNSGWIYEQILSISIVCTITVLMRSELISTIGLFDDSLPVGEDLNYWLRASRKYKIDRINKVFALYRNNLESITHTIPDHNYELLVIKNAIQQFGYKCPSGRIISKNKINQLLYKRSFKYGYQCFWAGDRLKAKESFRNSMGLAKYSLKIYSYLLISSSEILYNFIRHVWQRSL